MSTLITQIIDKMEAIPVQPNGDMLLTPADFSLDFMDTFFQQVLQQDTLLLTNAQKPPPGTDTVTVKGTSGLLGYKIWRSN